ncbi:hypothetical protein ATI61_103247 [Archangium gephyra]|uniref:Lipoprotein n=1 Tax=Archangium gephyra TaxID=48 RepID=A0AAC8Q6U7_9BACT|nr:hypothetical protein [Archangium gephyra]AKJ01538.1 Hypothetical protein AA314_03164 [Archangium gephyra]REG34354.1 hypothetical protein ATI61_103247 [Archangium gephyra]
MPLNKTLRARAMAHGWALLLLGATLLTTGCVTVAPRSGASCQMPGMGMAPPLCGGQASVPDGPDFSSGDEESLLAPFLACRSPAELVALQQRVDMPRLLEALDDLRK